MSREMSSTNACYLPEANPIGRERGKRVPHRGEHADPRLALDDRLCPSRIRDLLDQLRDRGIGVPDYLYGALVGAVD